MVNEEGYVAALVVAVRGLWFGDANQGSISVGFEWTCLGLGTRRQRSAPSASPLSQIRYLPDSHVTSHSE